MRHFFYWSLSYTPAPRPRKPWPSQSPRRSSLPWRRPVFRDEQLTPLRAHAKLHPAEGFHRHGRHPCDSCAAHQGKCSPVAMRHFFYWSLSYTPAPWPRKPWPSQSPRRSSLPPSEYDPYEDDVFRGLKGLAAGSRDSGVRARE
jgi:hypothetical protein